MTPLTVPPSVERIEVEKTAGPSSLVVSERDSFRINGVSGDFDARFSVDAADDGTLVVADVVDGNAFVLSPSGERRDLTLIDGDSPLFGATMMGGRPVVAGLGKFLVFDQASRSPAQTIELQDSLWAVRGLPDSTIVGVEMSGGILVRYGSGGRELDHFVAMPTLSTNTAPQPEELWPSAQFAVGTERVYVTGSEAYEIIAYSTGGEALWLLVRDVEREPISVDAYPRAAVRTRRAGRAMRRNVDDKWADVTWPTHYPAIERIEADSRDNLYVFPRMAEKEPDGGFLVDVYSPSGELIASGTLPFQGWDAAASELVYRIESRDGESFVVSYRIELPNDDLPRPEVGR